MKQVEVVTTGTTRVTSASHEWFLSVPLMMTLIENVNVYIKIIIFYQFYQFLVIIMLLSLPKFYHRYSYSYYYCVIFSQYR